MIKDLTHHDFDKSIESGLVIVDFWADWCGPCRLLAPTIEQVAREHPALQVYKLNVDEYPEVASRHGVMSIPTLLFFVDGELRDSTVGVVSKSIIDKKISMLQV